MGNSCNKVTPIVCTVRCSVTVPLWCQTAPSNKKVHPDVIEPKRKEEPAQTPQEAPPAPLLAPPAAPPATATPEPPSPEPKQAPLLDPVEAFESAALVSPGPQSQRAESIAAEEPDAPTTSSSGVAQPGTKGSEAVEVTHVESLEQDDVKSIAPPEEPLGVQPVDDDVDDAESAPTKKPADAEDDTAATPFSETPNTEGDDRAEGHEEKAATEPSERDADVEEKNTDGDRSEADQEEEGANEESRSILGDEDGAGSPFTASPEASDDEAEAEFPFSPDGRAALERFSLRDDVETIAKRQSGLAAADAMQTICLDAMDAGAAAQNCELLLEQVKIILHVLARAHESGARKIVKPLLVQLHPILETVQLLVSEWKSRGTVEKFSLGRAVDDGFLDVHLKLKDFAQGEDFLKAFHSLPDADEAAALAMKQASQPLSGYGSVEASRAAFERLLLLFILRYKPTKMRTQKQRLIDLLAVYNDPTKAAAWGCETEEDKLEDLAKKRLGRAATHAVPLMVVLMTNMWGASGDSVPPGRTDKWRMAVKMALQPLKDFAAATGRYDLPVLPVVPLDDVQPWDESA